jgi:hypothetical protein
MLHCSKNIPFVFMGPSVVAGQQPSILDTTDTTLNVPISVFVPININIQNAQICASILSSGSQTCQQIILNPTQTDYNPVGVDLSQREGLDKVAVLAKAQSTRRIFLGVGEDEFLIFGHTHVPFVEVKKKSGRNHMNVLFQI